MKYIRLLFIMSALAPSCSSAKNYIFHPENCSELEYEHIQPLLDTKKLHWFVHPFSSSQCVPISFTPEDTSQLTANDFDGIDGLYQVYADYLASAETMVTVIQLSSSNYVKFVKLNSQGTDSKQSELLFRFVKKNSNGTLNAYFEKWLFLHEIFHLSNISNAINHRNDRRRVEAIADVGSTLVLYVSEDMSMEYATSLMIDVSRVRKLMSRKGIDHYDKRRHKRILKNFTVALDHIDNSMRFKNMSLSDLLKAVEPIALDAQKLNYEEFSKKYTQHH